MRNLQRIEQQNEFVYVNYEEFDISNNLIDYYIKFNYCDMIE